MRKGTTVTTTRPATGHRPMTQDEYATWRREIIAAYGPHDCAGESWVHCGVADIAIPVGTPLTILRARVSCRVGWGYDRPHYAEVMTPTGEVLKVARASLA